MNRRAMATAVLLSITATTGAASATRIGYERDTTARPQHDSSAMRPAMTRDTSHLTRGAAPVVHDRVFHRSVERVRPAGDASARPNAAAKQGAASRNQLAAEDGILSRQHLKKAQGVLDAKMAKASRGHATSSMSNGGSSSRDARRMASKLRAVANGPQGTLDKRFLKQMQGLVDKGMAKATKGHATTRESNGGNDSRKARIGASKTRGAAAEGQSVAGRLYLKKLRALLQKAKAKHAHAEGR